MKKSVRTAIILVLVVILLGVGGALLWHMNHYVLIDSEFYPKDLQVLDLRGQDISISRYEKLHRQLSACDILWDVPFQDRTYPSDTTVLTVTTLAQEDLDRLRYFPRLQKLDADQCPDTDVILAVCKAYPQLDVSYQVSVNGQSVAGDTRLLHLADVSQQDIRMLSALPQLHTVALAGATDLSVARELESYCQEKGLELCIVLGADTYARDAQQLQIRGLTQEQMTLLELMPDLKKLHIQEPAASAESLLAFRDSHPGLKMTWEKTIWGVTLADSVTEVDLSQSQFGTLEEVEQGMAYLPQVTELFLGFCGLDNEAISGFRERSREQFKVVWVVDLSGKMQVRTDIDNFMPSRDGWGYVRDGEIDNIRYCEELICIDIGHMGVKDVSFLETLVNLEYLILAHTEVQYIDAIVNCKKLKYLELDWSCIRDVSPLVECTALEDLNLGMAWPDITPVLQMTWLKNLYLIKGNTRANFAEALPNTRVVTSGEYTVSSGWRQLPNYYAMRDILGMYYM